MADQANDKRKPLRALGVRAALFLALQLVVLGWLLRSYRTDERLLIAAVNAKHARLESLAAPRLMLVGGSNVLYGLDSQRDRRGVGHAARRQHGAHVARRAALHARGD